MRCSGLVLGAWGLGAFACSPPGTSEPVAVVAKPVTATVSAELETDPPIHGPSAAGSSKPRVAWNGSVFLAAWMEDRAGPNQVFGTRIAPSGQILDKTSFPIGDAFSGLFSTTSVASDGKDFVVVWDQWDSVKQTSAQVASWVASDGTVLSPNPLVIASPVDAYLSDVVFDGARYLLLGSLTSVSLRTLDTSKKVGPLLQVAQPLAGHVPTPLRASCVAQSCFVAWLESSSTPKSAVVRIARVQGGVPIPGSTLTVATNASDVLATSPPGIGCAASGCFLAWAEEKLLWGKHVGVVRGTRLGWDGVVSDPTGIDVLVPAPPTKPLSKPDSFGEPSVEPTAGGFVVFAAGKKDNLARVGSDGAVTPIAVDLGYYGAASSDLVAGSSGLLAAWSAGHAFGMRLGIDGTPLDAPGFHLARAANAQGQPAVAATAAGYLVSWEDSRGASPGSLVHSARFDPAGKLLDSAAIPIVAPGVEGFNPVSVHDASGFVVAFTSPSGGNASIRRVSESLVPLGPTTTFPFTAHPTRIALAPLGANTVAVAPLAGGLRGQLLTASGEWSDAGATQWSVDGGATLAAAASDGTRAIVAFQTGPAPGPANVEALRIDSSGAPVDGKPVLVAAGAAAPAIAHGAGRYLLAWLGENNAIHVRLVDDQVDGLHCTAEQVIQNPAPYAWVLRATFDGSGFLVVWSAEYWTSAPPTAAFAARVRADGVLLDPSGFSIAPSARAIAVASTGNGSALAAYHRYDSDPQFRAKRVKAVLVTSGTPPVAPGALDAGPCPPSVPTDAGLDAGDATTTADGDVVESGDAPSTPDADPADGGAAIDSSEEGSALYPAGGCACECRSRRASASELLWLLVGIGVLRRSRALARRDLRTDRRARGRWALRSRP